jgi:hypothetical protein
MLVGWLYDEPADFMECYGRVIVLKPRISDVAIPKHNLAVRLWCHSRFPPGGGGAFTNDVKCGF